MLLIQDQVNLNEIRMIISAFLLNPMFLLCLEDLFSLGETEKLGGTYCIKLENTLS